MTKRCDRKLIAVFEAALLQSTPSAKPIKFGPEGESHITFECDAQQQTEIMKMIGLNEQTFKITVEKS